MTCRELTEFLADYLDGELPERREQVFEQHLAGCPDCRRYLDSYRRTVKAAKAAYTAQDDTISQDVPPALLRAVLEARRHV
jgi:anti-sigma factor RsiW